MKTNDLSFNFIRAICALGIIVFHFSCYLPDTLYRPLLNTANCSWGSCIVVVFFVLSGTLIYRNNKTITSVKHFYIKRAKTIFPAFYLAFFYCFLINVITSGKLFYLGNAKSLLLSVLGMDGYFLYKGPNYYILGEWFLGAIILLYLLYPVLVKLFNRFPIMTFGVVTCMFIFAICFTGFDIPAERNLFSCLFCFAFGMIIERYELYKKALLLLPCTAIFVILVFFHVPVKAVICSRLIGICLTFILYYIGKLIMRFKYTRLVFNEISSVSYPIFLLQHLIIVFVLTNIPPADNFAVLSKLMFTTVLIIAAAKVLNIVTKAVLR